MSRPGGEEPAGFPDGEYRLVYLDEEYLMWTGDAKSQEFRDWLEKIQGPGSTG